LADTIGVERLGDAAAAEYDTFVRSVPDALLYHGDQYRRLLSGLLGAEPAYFCARTGGGRMVGVLPAFISGDGLHGPVLNSLPFYGSNGGVIVAPGYDQATPVLLDACRTHAEARGCAAATIVSSPLDADGTIYESHFPHDLIETRTGQVSTLPPRGEQSDAALMQQFHRKTRAVVTKAETAGMSVASESTAEALAFIAAEHRAAILAKSGLPKPDRFFDLVAAGFEYGRDYETFIARLDGKPIAGLLLFYFNQTVEYFTPVVQPDFRALQPLSLIIWHAMRAAIARGMRFWNWGGTWASQTTLYFFKQRWGAVDRPYRYYTRIFNPALLKATPAELLQAYPYFFVAPFDRLQVPNAS
jgi:hypothetical protein